MIAERRPVRVGDPARLQAQDLRLDVLSQLAPLEYSEVAAVFRAGVARMPASELGEVGPLNQLGAEQLAPDARGLPGRVGGAALRHDQNVPRMVGEAGFELLPVGLDVLGDLGLGHRNPEPHLPVDHTRHAELVADPLLDRLHGEALRLEELLELLATPHLQLLDPLRQLLLDLGLIHRDLLALGLLGLEPVLDHLREELLDVLVLGLRRGARPRRSRLLRCLRRLHRGDDRLGLGFVLCPAEPRHPRRRRAAAQRKREQPGRRGPTDHGRPSPSRRRSSEARTRAHSPRSTTASIVNSRFILSRPRLPSIARTSRRGSRGVPGANVTSATPSPASSFSTPRLRAATRKWTMSKSCSASVGGGPNRSRSSARRSSTSASLTALASRL